MHKLYLDKLSLSFKSASTIINALDNLIFSISPGQTFALLGESGCGKSMTASAIMQLLPQNAYCHKSSKCLFERQDLLELTEKQMQAFRGKKMAMIFQEPMTSLNPVLTIGQQIQEVLLQNGFQGKALVNQKTLALLAAVELPEPERLIHQYPHQISGGQKQRVMIAMAMSCQPDLLIADEPTTALDVTIQAQILDLLSKLTKDNKMAMLLITHDLSIVRSRSSHVAVMYAGQIVEQCSTRSFFEDPKHPYSQKLLACLPSLNKRGQKLHPIPGIVPSLQAMPKGCRFKSRCFKAKNKCDVEPDIDPSQSHQVRCHFPEQALFAAKIESLGSTKVISKQTVLQVSNLKIHYPIRKGLLKRQVGVVKAVDGVSFDIKQAETLALVGESGCGKTTLSRGICQLLPITSGEVIINNNVIKSYNRNLATSLQIIFQDPFSSMNPRMLVEDILLEGLHAQPKKLSAIELNKKVKELLEMVGLDQKSSQRYPHEFSGGQRQRISIARALALSPRILICDEPTSALDVSIQAQILNLLLELQQELKLSYLFISHDLAVVSYLADRIMVMQQGCIVEMGQAESIISQPKHAYTKQLLKSVA